jgi:hypothetical protein
MIMREPRPKRSDPHTYIRSAENFDLTTSL